MKAWLVLLARSAASLKLRVTLGAVAALIAGVAVITVLLVQRAERDTLALERQRELSEAVRTAALLTRRVAQQQRLLGIAAEHIDRRWISEPDRLIAYLDGHPLLRSLFTEVYVANTDGQVLAAGDARSARASTLDVGDRPYLLESLRTGRPVVSAPIAGRNTGTPVVVLVQPIRDAAGIFGLLGATLRLSDGEVLDGLVSSAATEADTLIVVTDSEGTVLAHPRRDMLLRPVTAEPRLREAFEDWVAGGKAVEPAGLVLSAGAALVSGAGVPGPDWMVWHSRPSDAILAPLRDARTAAAYWATGAILLFSVMLFVLLWWLLRPLSQLERRAARLFEAGADPGMDWPEALGEIGRLSRVLRRVGIERAGLESANNELLGKLESVMTSAPVGIAFTQSKQMELVSDEFCRLFRARREQLRGRSIEDIFATEADAAAILAKQRDHRVPFDAYLGEWPLRRPDGSGFWGSVRCRPVDPDAPASGLIWSVLDVDDQRLMREQLEWSALHDALTGCANRKLFEQRVERVMEAPSLFSPAALVFIDLDHFKPINDSSGHLAGDAILRAVAAALMGQTRAGDLVARLGGDEFAVLLEQCPIDDALDTAQRILDAVSAVALHWEGRVLQVGASIGVAELTPAMRTIADWLKVADAACYVAKVSGRRAVHLAPVAAARATGQENTQEA